ncbi:fibronectin type III domain-containing protein [Bdellovibrio sp. HCB337]|uniref:fibronectin type III domain-containing protein n=1 Tax=Bdellovibrio sp. HCB337 TaxID=3394358 RepID=UPI0039A475DC
MTVLPACKFDNKPCATEVEESVALQPVKGSNHLFMSVEKLDFLSDRTIVWDDIELELVLDGKQTITENIPLSFNGFKFSRKDGRRSMESMDYNKKKNVSSGKFKLHKVYLNGAEPFHMFLARIKKNDGVLKVHLHGKKLAVVSAKITFKGKSYSKCPEPSPTPGTTPTPEPTPVPVAPDTTLDSADPAKSPTSSTSISFYFSSSTEGNSFWCSLDGAAAEMCSSPYSYSNLASGTHSFKVYAKSPQGLEDATPASYSWKVDAIAPTVTITNSSSLPELTNSREMTFDFTASKQGSTFKCSFDGATAVACSSPMTYSGLAEGVHLFSVNATDSLGNVGKAPATFRWTVDATAPTASFIDISPIDSVGQSTDKNFVFSADETSTFECSFDNGAYAACASPLAMSGLSEGSHLLKVRAIDAAQNQGLEISYSWIIDRTAPEIALGVVSPAAGLTNAKNISVEFALSETAESFCSFDGAQAEACQSPFVAKDLNEGEHTLVISAADAAGNLSAPKELTWSIDLTAPVVSFGDILPSAASNINVDHLEMAINAPQGASLFASVNGGAASAFQNPLSLQGLAEGSYSVSVYGVDEAGNSSPAVTHQFIVDQTAPVASLAAEITMSPTNSDRNAFAMSSNEDGSFECNLDNAGFAACESPRENSGLADGMHMMQVRAVDLAGNISATVQYNWVVDTKAPGTSVNGSVSADQASVSLSSDEPDVTYMCSLDGAPMSSCGAVVSYSGLALGSHTFIAKAVDAAGNMDPVGASYQFAVIKPIKTIITSATPGESPTNKVTMTVTFEADQANATFLCSLDGASFQACVSPKVYTGIGDGSHKITVKAVDAFGNMDVVGASYSWVVDTTAPSVSGPSFSVTTNTITVTWTTSEPATSQVWFGVGANINQATAESSTLKTSHSVTLTGLSSNTTYSVQVRGHDAVGNAYTGVTRTVKTNR